MPGPKPGALPAWLLPINWGQLFAVHLEPPSKRRKGEKVKGGSYERGEWKNNSEDKSFVAVTPRGVTASSRKLFLEAEVR